MSQGLGLMTSECAGRSSIRFPAIEAAITTRTARTLFGFGRVRSTRMISPSKTIGRHSSLVPSPTTHLYLLPSVFGLRDADAISILTSGLHQLQRSIVATFKRERSGRIQRSRTFFLA